MKNIRIICLILGFVLFPGGAGFCQNHDSELIENLRRIENKMSNINTLATKFVQEKNLALFDQVIEIKGSLYLKKPSSFAWHIESPLRQRIILNDTMMKQWDEDTNQIQKINLANNPSFSVVTEQMKRWVSGSYLALVGEYKIEILQFSPLKLKFTPNQDSMAFKMIDSIDILFQDDEKYIDTINIFETNLDSTKLQFLETSLNEVLDSSVWKVRGNE